MNSGLLLTVTTEPESLRRRKDKIRANRNGRVLGMRFGCGIHKVFSVTKTSVISCGFSKRLRPAELLEFPPRVVVGYM